MMPTTKATTNPEPKISPVAVRVVQNATSWSASPARVKTRVSAGNAARKACATLSGSAPGFSVTRPRLTASRGRRGKMRKKLGSAASTTPSPRKPVPSTYWPPIVMRWPSSSTTRPVVSGPKIERVWLSTSTVSARSSVVRLVVDIGDGENAGTRIDADHRDVDAEAAAAVLPFGAAEIERARLRHTGIGAHRGRAAPRENCQDSRLEDVFVGSDQQVEAHVVIDQHAALRHRDEEAELDEDQQDRDEDAADRQRGAALLVGQYAPGDLERHGRIILNAIPTVEVYRMPRHRRRGDADLALLAVIARRAATKQSLRQGSLGGEIASLRSQ